ncbi:ZIP family metal transporter [Microlunatus sp. Gsoil 973]|uniref:ZIP family metal transporter n=1 Tax=Microlunatus sp. Gsoil 973 TaxID=2672569 RepID=UPI0012B4FF66|nr:hypothetical protein [Microlunatus sp. Gsoil 973]QGN33297.1 hypothetical protein GJV80_11310 [Microlunatus sp. Gsoil 973]
MLAAAAWGALAASSLILGALFGVARDWRDGLVGGVLAFGAGALVSGVSFELAAEGFRVGGPWWVAAGIAVGALAFFSADRGVQRLGGRQGGGSAGLPLALGALLDGIPEQAVLGIGLASGEGISLALLVAIFVSNLPEGIGSASEMRAAGRSRSAVVRMWIGVAVFAALSTVGGYLLADVLGPAWRAAIDGFAAGALLVMLVDSMVPEAHRKARDRAGLVTVLGFAVAAALSAFS